MKKILLCILYIFSLSLYTNINANEPTYEELKQEIIDNIELQKDNDIEYITNQLLTQKQGFDNERNDYWDTELIRFNDGTNQYWDAELARYNEQTNEYWDDYQISEIQLIMDYFNTNEPGNSLGLEEAIQELKDYVLINREEQLNYNIDTISPMRQ